MPMEINPRVVFERLFGDGGNAAERLAQVAARRAASSTRCSRKRRGCSGRSAPAIGRKVDEYLEAVREVEQRIQRAEQQTGELDARRLPDRPTDIPESFDEHAKLMFDLQVLAYQADITRVLHVLLGREQSGRAFPRSASPSRTTRSRTTATIRS